MNEDVMVSFIYCGYLATCSLSVRHSKDTSWKSIITSVTALSNTGKSQGWDRTHNRGILVASSTWIDGVLFVRIRVFTKYI